MAAQLQAFRAQILHYLRDPALPGVSLPYENFEDGVLLVDGGKIAGIGPAHAMLSALPKGLAVTHFPESLIIPGFVDCHTHYPQTAVIASPAANTLEWLEKHTFPAEKEFADEAFGRERARFFLEQLLRNGTTTALVFATVHPQSVEAIFFEAQNKKMRLIAGKVMMDRNAPAYLLDTAESSVAQSRELIHRWHGKGRLGYAITPRFAPTSSEKQLKGAGELLKEFRAENAGVHLHTHLAETEKELEWVKKLFPKRGSYLDVYDHYGLLGDKSVFAHAIHLSKDDFRRLGETQSSVCFCPSSNLFLGSGLFNLEVAMKSGTRVGMGTDVGGGTSFSQFQTMAEGHKVLQLRRQFLSGTKGFYQATLGGAQALSLDGFIGNFEKGKEADFTVIDLAATPLVKQRLKTVRDLEEKLFVLMTLGDDRLIRATYLMGACAHLREN